MPEHDERSELQQVRKCVADVVNGVLQRDTTASTKLLFKPGDNYVFHECYRFCG